MGRLRGHQPVPPISRRKLPLHTQPCRAHSCKPRRSCREPRHWPRSRWHRVRGAVWPGQRHRKTTAVNHPLRDALQRRTPHLLGTVACARRLPPLHACVAKRCLAHQLRHKLLLHCSGGCTRAHREHNRCSGAGRRVSPCRRPCRQSWRPHCCSLVP